MRKLWIVAICSLTLLTACSQKDDSLGEYESNLEEEKTKFTEILNEKEKKIEELNQTIQQLNTKIDNYDTEKENYAFISNISMEFVQAHTTGDMDKLRQLLLDDIMLEEKDNKLYVKDANGDEWLLFNNEKKIYLDDWVIQGYEYDPKSNTFQIFIREFYTDLKGEPEIPPTFLHLSFIKFNEEWKIAGLEFDI